MRKLVRIVSTVLMLGLVAATAANAQTYEWSETQGAELDRLFAELTAATDEASARATADAIWSIWTRPDDADIAARMREIIEQGGFAGPASQMPLIEELVTDYPDYPEGWNQSATANFLRGDYEAALSDIEETLKREPRHFGAMAGRALIYHTQGKLEEALEAIGQALELHPYLPERGLFPELGAPPIKS